MHIQSFPIDTPAVGTFIEVAHRLRSGDTRWVRPIEATTRAELSAANPFFAHGSMRLFLVSSPHGEVVGRCAATLDPRMRHDEQPAGAIGFFEVADDFDAARALLDAAAEWLRTAGARTICGPMDFGIFCRYRFKTAGLDTEPFLGEPHQPAYYPQLFERYGFRPLEKSGSWDLLEHHMAEMTRNLEAAASAKHVATAGYGYRPFDMACFDTEFRVFFDLIIAAFTEHTGFVPISFPEFQFYNAAARAFLDPRLVQFITGPDGTAVGAGYAFPDFAPMLRLANGDGSPEVLVAAGMKAPPRRVVLHTAMVRPEHRVRGVVPGMVLEVLKGAADAGLSTGIGAFAKLEQGSLFEKIFGVAPCTREYTLYALEA